MMRKKKHSPDAGHIITETLRPIRVEQVKDYVEKTGWTLHANHFSWADGWSLQPALERPITLLYTKPDPRNDRPFVVQVPGREEFRDYVGQLQMAIQRIAAVEQTTFVTIVCRILDKKQIVLSPIE